MFALLGEITFEVVGSPESFESSVSYGYAEHRVLEAPPRLEWLGRGLESLRLGILFHVSFTDPAAGLRALRNAALDHRARALVLGNGVHRGHFVITALNETWRQLNGAGDPVAIEVRLALKEWEAGAEADPFAPPMPAGRPLALVPEADGPVPGAGSSATAARNSRQSDFRREEAGRSVLMKVIPPPADRGPQAMPGDVPLSVITRNGG